MLASLSRRVGSAKSPSSVKVLCAWETGSSASSTAAPMVWQHLVCVVRPAGHEAHWELPCAFAGSAMASAGGVGLLGAPPGQTTAPRRMAVAGAALELAASHRMEHRLGLIGEVYRTGRAGAVLRASRALTAAGAVGALFGRRSRLAGGMSGVLLNAGAASLRYAVFTAGVTSAKDPKYTVAPQRQRLDARAQDAETTATS